MNDDVRSTATDNSTTTDNEISSQKDNSPPMPAAAQRALAEAEARRNAVAATQLPNEIGGRDGPDPVRYGDWEKNGIAVDF